MDAKSANFVKNPKTPQAKPQVADRIDERSEVHNTRFLENHKAIPADSAGYKISAFFLLKWLDSAES